MVGTYHLWFRQKYNLPPTDPRFLNATDEEIEADFWAHYYQENPNINPEAEQDFNDIAQSIEDGSFFDDIEELERMIHAAPSKANTEKANDEWETVIDDHFS